MYKMDDWAKAAISFGSGVLTGGITPYIHQLFQRRRVRRSLYFEILYMYGFLKQFPDTYEENAAVPFDARVAKIKRDFTFESFEYAKRNLEVFHSLKEFPHIYDIYDAVRALQPSRFQDNRDYLSAVKDTVWEIEMKIWSNALGAKTLLRSSPPDEDLRKLVEDLAYHKGAKPQSPGSERRSSV